MVYLFSIYSSFFFIQARRRRGKREQIKVCKLSQALLVYGLLGTGTKKSEISAEKSPKNRFSVVLEKKNASKIRLPEKSAENRLYRRFFAEKSATDEKSVERSAVVDTRWKARLLLEKSAKNRRDIEFIADKSAIYRPFCRQNPGRPDSIPALIQRCRFVPCFF